MICIVTQHFGLQRILLLSVGLWPYHRSKLVRFQQYLFFVIQVGFIVFQFTSFLTVECTTDFTIQVLSITLYFVTCLIKFNSFWINIHGVTRLLEQLQHLCDEIKDKNEIAIIKKYGKDTKWYTMILTSVAICVITFMTLLPILLAWIFDTFLHSNGTRTCDMNIKQRMFKTEYFVDPQKYSYLILLHTYAAIYIGIIALVGTGTTMIGYLKHACAFFRIASYRIEQAMNMNTMGNINTTNKMQRGIKHAVDLHCKTIEYSELYMNIFEGTFITSESINVLCLSLNLFQLFQISSFSDDVFEFILHLIFANAILAYMFIANLVGQEITDHYNRIFSSTYNVHWYMAPLRIQKSVLLLLQRSNKNFYIKVVGVFLASFECFASLSTTSLSYFTVIYSIKQ
ncbi:Or9e1 [Eciton burchellii]|nr:Or9e1 [Eciton burchellii]